MQTLIDIENRLLKELEAKPMTADLETWYECLSNNDSGSYVPLQYKPGFLQYQAAYFSDVYDDFRDISMVLYRGGHPVAIWPVCIYIQNEKLCFGTAGTALMAPLFSSLPKAEAQRSVIENCLKAIFEAAEENGCDEIIFNETIMDCGASQWIRKLMEHGAKEKEQRWEVFADLSLSQAEIQSRIRRTNKYSVAKGQDAYNIEIYDESSDNLAEAFSEFHKMHREVAGKETRSQKTWDEQEKIVRDGGDKKGHSFLVFIRDKESGALAGSALFDTTPQTGLYCVAAYDRSRFSKPVGHIVQAVAMEQMRSYGVRWYEIGERAYQSEEFSNQKLVDIGHYKEGFATHFYPRIFVSLCHKDFFENIQN